MGYWQHAYMLNDAGTGWISGTLGSNASLANSQCSVNLAASSFSGSGYTETGALAITFAATYTGSKTIYGFAADKSGTSTKWVTLGAWTVN